jgi:hypothetical protein
MRLMMMLKATRDTEAGVFPSKELVEEMGALMEDMAKAGILLGGDGLQPSSKGKRVRFSGGKVTEVIDGPFTETKELIAGFAMIQVKTWDEAMYWTERFARAQGEGESELRPLFDTEDFPPEILSPEAAAREDVLRAELQRKASAQ